MNAFKKAVIFSAVLFCCVRAGSAQRACCSVPPVSYWTDSYQHVLVGNDPALGSSTSTTAIAIIPLRLVFLKDGRRLDPSAVVCNGNGQSAINLIASSPLFQYADFSAFGQGTTQYTDAVQRANLWDQVSTVAPDYHTLLQLHIFPAQEVIVPADQESSPAPHPTACASGAYVNKGFLENSTLTVAKNLGVSPNMLPVFITLNTVMSGQAGYHSAWCCENYHQYIVASFFDDPSLFSDVSPNVTDIYPLSHELVEWLNNPGGGNSAPGWHGGPYGGCQSPFESADPFNGEGLTMLLNGFNYHLTDVAFRSWFMREQPSKAFNNQYTFTGNTYYTPSSCFTAQRRRQRWDLNGDQTSDVLMVDSTASKCWVSGL